MKQYIRKADIILFIALIVIGLAASAALTLSRTDAGADAKVVIESGGDLYARYPLAVMPDTRLPRTVLLSCLHLSRIVLMPPLQTATSRLQKSMTTTMWSRSAAARYQLLKLHAKIRCALSTVRSLIRVKASSVCPTAW